MSHELEPKVGRWYRRLDNEEIFKVVSIDEDDGLIEIKSAGGELEELDAPEWIELDLEYSEAPEDYIEPDENEEDDEDAERPARGRAVRGDRDDDDDEDDDEDWDDDEDDEDEDEDEDYHSDR